MKILFVPTGGRPTFKMEVGNSDTVSDLKSKIQKCQGIPVCEIDDLVLRDTTLDEYDGSTVSDYCITENSVIDVIIFKKPQAKYQTTVKLLVRMPVPPMLWEEMEFNLVFDTVKNVKDKVRRFGKIEPSRRIHLFVNGSELEDDELFLRQCPLFENCRVLASLYKQYQDQDRPSNAGVDVVSNIVKLKVVVAVLGRNVRIPVTVSGGDVVAVLRKEMEKIKDRVGLSGNRYFFIYKEKRMKEEQSFRWHGVADGDKIEVLQEKSAGG